jgi:hypothetical protein
VITYEVVGDIDLEYFESDEETEYFIVVSFDDAEPVRPFDAETVTGWLVE